MPGDDPDGRATVRPARPADEGALLAVQSALPRPNPDLLRGALSGVGRVLVSAVDGCEAGGVPVGYLLALDRAAAPDTPGDRPATATDDGETGAYIAELAVAPGHRREGRATALLGALFDDLDGGWVTLTVHPENEAARRCYEAVGFRELRREVEFFGDEPALVLGRRVGAGPE